MEIEKLIIKPDKKEYFDGEWKELDGPDSRYFSTRIVSWTVKIKSHGHRLLATIKYWNGKFWYNGNFYTEFQDAVGSIIEDFSYE